MASLVLDASGNLYGTTAGDGYFPGTVFTLRTDGTGFQTLHAFARGGNDGMVPFAPLTLDGFGNLYGTTVVGGSSGGGTIFMLKSDGTGFRLLHSFAGGASDGHYPYASLLLDESGNLYGTTITGGQTPVHSDTGYYGIYDGSGTVFRIRTDGTGFQLLHSFVGGANDADTPQSALISDGSGNLLGTTYRGGPPNAGTVFSISTHTFTLSPSGYGRLPAAPLVLDGSGNLYGTTSYGGGPSNAFGTVFTVRTDGTGFRVLHTFTDSPDDGRYPFAPLIMDRTGILYGTTSGFGPSFNSTVFRLEPDGTGFQLLHAFGGSDGEGPLAALMLDDFGNLYGTTYYGGPSAAGTVFTVRTDGTGYRILHAFGEDEGDGKNPASSLFLDGSRTLFGTTVNGGAGTFGTVFALSLDQHHPVVTLGPFVPVRRH